LVLEGSVAVLAPPSRVFALWSDAAGWPSWDPDLSDASLDGPFAAGSRGSLKPVSGPRTRIELTEVEADRGFEAVARLPLCRLRFVHRVEPVGSGCRVSHSVHFSGPFAVLFRQLIGPSMQRGLPGTLAGLKAAAEAG